MVGCISWVLHRVRSNVDISLTCKEKWLNYYLGLLLGRYSASLHYPGPGDFTSKPVFGPMQFSGPVPKHCCPDFRNFFSTSLNFCSKYFHGRSFFRWRIENTASLSPISWLGLQGWTFLLPISIGCIAWRCSTWDGQLLDIRSPGGQRQILISKQHPN